VADVAVSAAANTAVTAATLVLVAHAIMMGVRLVDQPWRREAIAMAVMATVTAWREIE